MSGSESFNHDIEKQNTLDHDSNPPVGPGRERNQSTATQFRHDDKHIYINDQCIDKDEFVYAFGGSLNVGSRKQTPNMRKLGDPVPAGLAAFSCTVISLGLIQMHARHVHAASVLIGALLTTSGLVELIVGILCFVVGNTWATCTFLMFGGFWSSYGFVLIDVNGASSAYTTSEAYAQSIALYFLPWALFSFFLWACTWKSTWALTILMFLIWFFILLFTIAQFAGSIKLYKAGGFFCMLSGVAGLYNMYVGLVDPTNSYFVPKPLYLPNAVRPGAEVKKE